MLDPELLKLCEGRQDGLADRLDLVVRGDDD